MNEPEIITTNAVEIAATRNSLAEMTRSEIEMQISTAKKFPRSIMLFRQKATEMSTIDAETAAGCYYKLSRGKGEDKKIIEGASIRLAEIVASSYGNIRVGARIIDISEKEVIAQGVAHDLETNFFISVEVHRKILDRFGKRFSEDMINLTCAAACAIAFRNATFKIIPMSYVKNIYEAAKKVAVGGAATLAERRQKALEAFSKMGISKEQIVRKFEKNGIEEIGLTEIEDMIGLYTALKEGITTIDEEFPKQTAVKPIEAKIEKPVDGKTERQKFNAAILTIKAAKGEDFLSNLMNNFECSIQKNIKDWTDEDYKFVNGLIEKGAGAK